MIMQQIWSRAHGRYQRTVANLFFRRPFKIENSVPYVSFTFDDFPRSALHTGGTILSQFGIRGTFYASLGLMGTMAPTGAIIEREDIKELLEQGHELGCHTFAHVHSWNTAPAEFEDSVIRNKRALDELVPGAVFKSFSYPIIGPCPGSKRRVGRHFRCCRGGGQSFNTGTIDLNLLKAYFLEKTRNDPRLAKEVIDKNCQAHGWLIFATHDVCETPTPYGCTPAFFEEIVMYAKASGARILPIDETLDAISRVS